MSVPEVLSDLWNHWGKLPRLSIDEEHLNADSWKVFYIEDYKPVLQEEMFVIDAEN